MNLLLQKSNTPEIRDLVHHANINDIHYQYCDIEAMEVGEYQDYMPVGSVEFVQKFFDLHGIARPKFDCYAPVIHDLLGRQIEKYIAYQLIHDKWLDNPVFLKPIETKRFNGFVFSGFVNYGQYDEHDWEQVEKLKAYISYERLYGCAPVKFIAEWRLYIVNGELKAACRYDHQDEEYHLPTDFVNDVVSRFPGVTIAVDIGLLDKGNFCVVELNDAWAIGKYRGISDADYFEFLVSRWGSIIGRHESI